MMGGTGDDTLNGGAGNDLLVGDLGDDVIIASAGEDIIRFGIGDGNDTYIGDAAYANTDVFVFEAGIEAEDVWFERIDNSLIVRIHGQDDTFTFENWFYGQGASAHVQGFSAGGEWLSYEQVNGLIDVMSGDIANLNDGTTAYGLLPGQTPEVILSAIDEAWG
jgi:Ca2+-binding RTX toxin-like protein